METRLGNERTTSIFNGIYCQILIRINNDKILICGEDDQENPVTILELTPDQATQFENAIKEAKRLIYQNIKIPTPDVLADLLEEKEFIENGKIKKESGKIKKESYLKRIFGKQKGET